MNSNSGQLFDKFGQMNYLPSIKLDLHFNAYSVQVKSESLVNFKTDLTNTRHSHNYYEICFVTAGKGQYRHDEKSYALKTNDIFIANPKMVHEISSFKTKDLELIFLTFDIRPNPQGKHLCLESKILKSFLNDHHICQPNNKNLLMHLNLLCEKNLNSALQKIRYQKILECLFFEMLDSLNKEPIQESKHTDTITLALEFIQDHLQQKIKIKSLAEYAHCSERNLRRLFHQRFQHTIVDEINERKLQLAMQKLKMGFNINETAAALGIDSSAQFSRLFKKHLGESPKAFQQKHSHMQYKKRTSFNENEGTNHDKA